MPLNGVEEPLNTGMGQEFFVQIKVKARQKYRIICTNSW
jgi:hypothetical protein